MRKLLAACCFLLSVASSPAFAGATHMYISEYNNIGQTGGFTSQVAGEPSTDQPPVDFSLGVASSAAFAASTQLVRVLCTVTCSIKFGTNPTATTSNKALAAGVPEYFAVPAGQNYKISVISNTDF